MRIALGIEYDGTRFSGWQRQAHAINIQDHVEQALSKVADQPIQVICAGRTDAGVHATAQVVHFDTGAERALRSWVFGTNSNLPSDIAVQWAQPVADDFHARFSARRRAYRFVILNRPVRPSFLLNRVLWDFRQLDAAKMADGARHLVGQHDFSSFRGIQCQARHAVREIYHLSVRRDGQLLYIDVEANAFLHHMVRNIVGVLLEVGVGRQPAEWVREVLRQRDRNSHRGTTVPPHGLYLTRVDYPAEWGIPSSAPPILAVDSV